MKQYSKAIYASIVGFAVAFLSALLPYLGDGGFPAVPDEGWVTATIAGLVSLGVVGGGVYQISNTPKEG